MTENGKINIGVFLSGDDDQLQGIIMDGIKERAAEKNCGVVAFHSLVNKSLFDATVLPAESVSSFRTIKSEIRGFIMI